MFNIKDMKCSRDSSRDHGHVSIASWPPIKMTFIQANCETNNHEFIDLYGCKLFETLQQEKKCPSTGTNTRLKSTSAKI
jgi:hypothetical protein